MEFYPKVESVAALPGKRLRVSFSGGAVRYYDCKPLLSHPAFRMLKDEAFFRNVRPDAGGYGVIWSDEVDLAESEIWLHGKEEEAA